METYPLLIVDAGAPAGKAAVTAPYDGRLLAEVEAGDEEGQAVSDEDAGDFGQALDLARPSSHVQDVHGRSLRLDATPSAMPDAKCQMPDLRSGRQGDVDRSDSSDMSDPNSGQTLRLVP